MSGTLPYLQRDHPTAVAFLDETGSVSGDRIFAIGCLKLSDPAAVLRQIRRVRDLRHRYGEIKFTRTRSRSHVEFYSEVVDCLMSDPKAQFFCFVADRTIADPIERFGTQWDAYAKLAEQLVSAHVATDEIVTVLADIYDTPGEILLEQTIREAVNRRLRRLAVASICQLDSRSTDGLQLVDLLTAGVAFGFRRDLGLAKAGGHKDQLAAHVRATLGMPEESESWRSEHHSIALYEHGSWNGG
ncbi:MAG: DUF3800 domain-containing protein [Acidimicrobiales bacterium]